MIEIIEKPEVTTVEVKTEIKMLQMAKFMGSVYPRIIEYVKSEGKEVTEAPYARYYNVDWDEMTTQSKFKMFIEVFTRKWSFSAGFPIEGEFKGEEDILPAALPGGKFIQSLHKGPYQKVGDTYKAMVNYAKENQLKIKAESIEFYTNDPRKVKKEDIETICLIPIEE